MESIVDGIARPRLGRPIQRAFWAAEAGGPDLPAAFRSDLIIDRPTSIVIMIQAARSFRLWLDGELLAAGPLRYAPSVPEVHTERLRLGAGRHALSVQANPGGITDRMMPSLPSYLWVSVTDEGGTEIELDWRARELTEYADTGLRSSPLLDRIEWLERPIDPVWRTAAPGPGWAPVTEVAGIETVLGPPTRGVIELPRWPTITPTEIASGRYRESYTGYRFDDPAVQFMLADLEPAQGSDTDGSWARYDLGRIRIGSLELTVDCEEPAEITIGYADRLDPRGGVAPVNALSTGPTSLIQHIAVGSGSSRVEPFGDFGARFVELRVRTTGTPTLSRIGFRDRDFLGEPVGSFGCDDPLLERIWAVGLDTMRACAEDALVDSVRERAEWIGDSAAAGFDLLVTGWGDLRLLHRTLLHSAASARDDGLVGGCIPGTPIYHLSYAALWLTACLRVADYDPTSELVRELEDAGRRNSAVLLSTAETMINSDPGERPSSFIDWGYAVPDGSTDQATLLLIIRGLRDWMRWQQLLQRPLDRAFADRYRGLVQRVQAMNPVAEQHVMTLAASAGIVPATTAAPVIAAALSRGFPLDPDATRLRDPGRDDPTIITPYFTNYSVPVLIEAGRIDIVWELWHRAWGWMLDQGATTWWEVFDDRWSHAHFWSGAPTWQLTRYVLGASVTTDAGRHVLQFAVYPGPLDRCWGTVPIGPDRTVELAWRRAGDRIDYTVNTDDELAIRTTTGIRLVPPGTSTLRLHSRDGISYRC